MPDVTQSKLWSTQGYSLECIALVLGCGLVLIRKAHFLFSKAQHNLAARSFSGQLDQYGHSPRNFIFLVEVVCLGNLCSASPVFNAFIVCL